MQVTIRTPLRTIIASCDTLHFSASAADSFRRQFVDGQIRHAKSIEWDFQGLRIIHHKACKALITPLFSRAPQGILQKLQFNNCSQQVRRQLDVAIDAGLDLLAEKMTLRQSPSMTTQQRMRLEVCKQITLRAKALLLDRSWPRDVPVHEAGHLVAALRLGETHLSAELESDKKGAVTANFRTMPANRAIAIALAGAAAGKAIVGCQDPPSDQDRQIIAEATRRGGNSVSAAPVISHELLITRCLDA